MPSCDQRSGGRTEAGDAAKRRRDAHRAAGIGADAARGEPRGDRDAGAAARAAGDARRIVGIAGRAERGVVVGHAVGELVQVGLAEHDRAGVEQRCTTGALRFGRLLAQAGRAAGGRHHRRVSILSLRASGTPCSGPSRRRAGAAVGAPGRGAHRVGIEADEGVERSAAAQRASSASASASAVISPLRIAAAASPTPSSASAAIFVPRRFAQSISKP